LEKLKVKEFAAAGLLAVKLTVRSTSKQWSGC